MPAGYLLGFTRKWRAKPNQANPGEIRCVAGHKPTPQETEILDIIKAAPITNRHFHASDLRRVIGSAAYAARVLAISVQHGCSTFTATLVVHGQAVLEGEITP